MSALKNLLATVAMASCALSAQAQVTTNLSYSLALTDAPMFNRYSGGQPCDIDSTPIDNRYRTMPMTVTATGAYSFSDVSGSNGTMAVYSGPFNPASLGTNCVASVDDGSTLTLAAGTYTLVMTSFGGVSPGEGAPDIPGNFAYRIEGPAAISLNVQPVNPTPTVTAVPTLSEWTLLLLAISAAGFGASRLRRES
ncbi:IPTL-CTERM sorting domain-containing protein [Ottowia thiooxydans]|uniref:IPTL-CTERM sorting domain-containing protein n=1 Tax=Ottowia thiooxydans TaxID=219182 RepID=UPI0004246252|nr:IPTL-CTERM sorting domain-containing protein [Ottowia thiooxydans]